MKTQNLVMAAKTLKADNRYGSTDDLFDYEHGVLKNKLGIMDRVQLLRHENELLLDAYEQLALEYDDFHSFSDLDIKYMHRVFLSPLYQWAGNYRIVDLSSGRIHWCHARYIQSQMERFGKRLQELTPINSSLKKPSLIERLAEIHGELLVIHPFRDGNGRVTRLLTNLLLLQSGRSFIQLDAFYDSMLKAQYYAAIEETWSKAAYTELYEFFDRVID